MDGGSYTSGRWQVKEGRQAQFIERWKEFVGWAATNIEGAENFMLLQSDDEPQRFVSVGRWASSEAIDRWENAPEFAELLGKCRELCDDFGSIDATRVASVKAG